MLELDLYITDWRSIGRRWLGRFDVSQEEVSWWWWFASVGRTPGEVERTRAAVDLDEWSHAGILRRFAGKEKFNWLSERILFVGRLYRWV